MVQFTLLKQTDTLLKGMDRVTHLKTLPHFSLVQAVSGHYELALNGGPAEKTTLFLAPPQALQTITHHMEPGTQTMHARWIFFDLEIEGCSGELRYHFSPAPPVADLMEEFFQTEDPCDRMSIGYRIVKQLLQTATPRNGREQDLLPVITHMKTHYREKITVGDLADRVHWSESKLYALFSETFGQSPIAYLNAYRLALATKLLKSTGDSIEEIALNVGIEDPRYFSKLFRRQYQCTPTEYRKNIIL